MESVPQNARDRQWYAVKQQLLENCVLKHTQFQRSILVQMYSEELKTLDSTIEKKYGDRSLSDVDLLPDA